MRGPPIRVLVVDDSAICREVLTQVLQCEGDITVVGTAGNGWQAVSLSTRLQPDVITMDIHMPGMDGFTAIEEILSRQPIPILVVTSSPVHQGVDRSFQALAVGALDLVRKPELEGPLAEQLREKVRILAGVRVVRRPRRMARSQATPTSERLRRSLVAIGASTGGPRVLLEILKPLPRRHPCCFLVTQHIPVGFTAGFAQWLGGELDLEVKLAQDGEACQPGRVLVAPSGLHLGLRNRHTVGLFDDPPLDNHRPSASFLFRSLARVCPEESVGIVLTGMGRDGAGGLRQLRAAGGLCVAQDEASSLVFGMPREAIESGAAERVLDVAGITNLLLSLDRSP